MKQILFLLFIINGLFLLSTSVSAQTATDTVQPYKERFGLRLGVDISKPIRAFLEEDYRGLEIMGDYRVYKDYYLAAELGNEQLPFDADNIKVTASGSYIKVGADYNAYDNWAGMENLMFAGIRYGFATFSQTLDSYTIYERDQHFPPSTITTPFESSGLTASWAELILGLKVEVLRNLYLGANVQIKTMIFQSTPNNFDNLVVPGFNRTYDDSRFGAGFGYNISYLIPLYRRAN